MTALAEASLDRAVISPSLCTATAPEAAVTAAASLVVGVATPATRPPTPGSIPMPSPGVGGPCTPPDPRGGDT
jgi:hypothetical protein